MVSNIDYEGRMATILSSSRKIDFAVGCDSYQFGGFKAYFRVPFSKFWSNDMFRKLRTAGQLERRNKRHLIKQYFAVHSKEELENVYIASVIAALEAKKS